MRQQRLAAELRANLKKRKDLARTKRSVPDEPPPRAKTDDRLKEL